MMIGQRSSGQGHAALAGLVPGEMTGAVGIELGRDGLAIGPGRRLRILRRGAPVVEIPSHSGLSRDADVIAETEAVV